MSISSILSSLKSALTSLQGLISQSWASLTSGGGGGGEHPPVQVTPSSGSTPTPTPTITPTPQPTPIGAPQPLPGGGTYQWTQAGTVYNLKEEPQYTPITGEGTIKGDWIYKNGKWQPLTVPELPAYRVNVETPITDLYREAVQAATQEPQYTPVTSEGTIKGDWIYQNGRWQLIQKTPTAQPIQPTGAIPTPTPSTIFKLAESQVPSVGVSPTPTYTGGSVGYGPTTGLGLTQAITPLSIANQGLLVLPQTKKEEEKEPQFTPIKEGQYGNWLYKNGKWQQIQTPTAQPAAQAPVQPIIQPIQPTTQKVQPLTETYKLPLTGGVLDISGIQTEITNASDEISKVSDLIKSGKVTSVEETQNYLTDIANKLKTYYDQLRTLPENPVPTEENLLETTPPDQQDTLKKLLDNIEKPDLDAIYQKYGVSNIIKEMTDLENQIMAESAAYDSLVKDIRDDPDFPKQLAQRRIQTIENARDINLKALELKYNFMVQRYNQTLNLVKDEIQQQQGIYQAALSSQEKAKTEATSAARTQIQQLISTGALGNLSDEQLKSLAESAGYTYDSLKAMAQSVSKKAISTGTSAIKGTTGATYESRLSEEVKNIYSGKYGTEGAREKAIKILQSEFPTIDVAKDIYNRVPDNWEKTGGAIYTGKNIPPQLRQSIIDTLTDTAGLQQLGRDLTIDDLIMLFPEVSSDTLESYYNQYYQPISTSGKKWWQFWK